MAISELASPNPLYFKVMPSPVGAARSYRWLKAISFTYATMVTVLRNYSMSAMIPAS